MRRIIHIERKTRVEIEERVMLCSCRRCCRCRVVKRFTRVSAVCKTADTCASIPALAGTGSV
jgi:hypothetical protein